MVKGSGPALAYAMEFAKARRKGTDSEPVLGQAVA